MCMAGGTVIWDAITPGFNALIGGGERALPLDAAFAITGEGGGGGLAFGTLGSIPVLDSDGSQLSHSDTRRDFSPLCSPFALALGGDARVGVCTRSLNSGGGAFCGFGVGFTDAWTAVAAVLASSAGLRATDSPLRAFVAAGAGKPAEVD